jgi:hypothetical protein
LLTGNSGTDKLRRISRACCSKVAGWHTKSAVKLSAMTQEQVAEKRANARVHDTVHRVLPHHIERPPELAHFGIVAPPDNFRVPTFETRVCAPSYDLCAPHARISGDGGRPTKRPELFNGKWSTKKQLIETSEPSVTRRGRSGQRKGCSVKKTNCLSGGKKTYRKFPEIAPATAVL